jgi:hypothetical protein
MLAEEARSENATMRELAERGYRDAVAIKILTIATLIYLPATVVSVRSHNKCPAVKSSSQVTEFLLHSVCQSSRNTRRLFN